MKFRVFTIYHLIILITLLSSCGGKEQKSISEPLSPSHTIIGEWQATWEMKGDDVKEMDISLRTMKGKIIFLDSANVEITTYGFDGNLIMTDTTQNILTWRIEDKILRFIDKNDVQGIPYVIEEMNDKEIRLSIMGDIYLTLKK